MSSTGSETTMGHDIRRVIILGHSGFIGRHLKSRFDRSAAGVAVEGYSAKEIDLETPQGAGALLDILDRSTVVVMLSGIKKQFGDTIGIFSRNMRMVENVCDVLRLKPARGVLFFSSAEVYGNEVDGVGIGEDTPVNPSTFYGIAKYASEKLFEKVAEREGGALVILRAPLVYGPGDTSRGYGPSGFIHAAIRGEEITLWGDGTEYREFLFVDDLVEIVLGLTLNTYRGVVNVVRGRSYTYQDVLHALRGVVGHELKVGTRTRTNRKVNHHFSGERLREVLPGVSFTALEDGIRKTYEAERRLHEQQIRDGQISDR